MMKSLPRPATALAAALAATCAATMIAATSAPAATAMAMLTAVSLPAAGHFHVITLPGGQRLAVSQVQVAGRSQLAASALPSGHADALITLTLSGTTYAIPFYAMPYLGHGLDPRLFSVAALLRAERGGRIFVTVGYHGRVPALPGVTITRTARGTATGYLTPSSARIFGAALARQYTTDRGGGRFGADGLFADGASVSLAGSAPAAARSAQRVTGQVSFLPSWRTAGTHTLTFQANDALGQPDNGGTVVLVNVDNSDLLAAASTFSGGTASFTVPDGRYFAAALFSDELDGYLVGLRSVVVPQITVSADATVRTDEAAASSRLTMVTPRPVAVQFEGFEVRRLPASGLPVDLGMADLGGIPIRVSPTSVPPSAGTMQTYAAQTLRSPASARAPYRYSLAYRNLSGTIAPQRYLVRRASLATVRARYDSAVTMSGDLFLIGEYSGQFLDNRETVFLFANEIPVSLPTRVTEYVTANPSLVWIADLTHIFSSGGIDTLQSDIRSYQPGARVAEEWNGYPLHPAPRVSVPGASAAGPLIGSATRAANTVTISLTPFTDNVPGHLGGGFLTSGRVSGSFTVEQDGRKIASGDAAESAFWRARLSSRPSVIRFVLGTVRTSRLYPLGTRTRTVWTWRSAPDPGATLPAGWICPPTLVNNPPNRHCAAQPLLALDYHVAGLSLRGSVPAGRQAVTVAVGHVDPSPSTAPVTHVTVLVSFDDGKTWQPATVRRAASSRFVAAFTAPATARFVALRVCATDAGGAVQETLLRAYRIVR